MATSKDIETNSDNSEETESIYDFLRRYEKRDKAQIKKILSSSKGSLTENQIDSILCTVSSYARFRTFLKIIPRLKGENYWHALSYAYTSSDNLFDLRNELKKAFQRRFTNRSKLMDAEELKYLNALPDNVLIYRGMTEHEFDSGKFGISCTLKKKTALFFCKTYIRNQSTDHLPKMIAKAIVNKKDIIAVFLRRKEFEIIITKNVLATKI